MFKLYEKRKVQKKVFVSKAHNLPSQNQNKLQKYDAPLKASWTIKAKHKKWSNQAGHHGPVI